MRARSLVPAMIAVATIAPGQPQPAAADALPPGSIGLVGGVRQGTGRAAGTFGLGALLGIEAGWAPMSTSQRVGWAVHWRALFSGYWSGASDNLADNLRVVEIDAGAALRFAPRPGELRFLDVGGGISFLRSNVPLLPPETQRAYTGPYGSIGLEQYVGVRYRITFEVRVGILGIGPTTASAIAGIKVGV